MASTFFLLQQSTPVDFMPSSSPLSAHAPSSHKHSLSFGRSRKTDFIPQPESFSSAPFCPPSPTASQYEAHLAPRPPSQHPPPRSASLPLGGGKKKKRLGSPRLKSPRTGGPLKPFGRKPDVATLDEVVSRSLLWPNFLNVRSLIWRLLTAWN